MSQKHFREQLSKVLSKLEKDKDKLFTAAKASKKPKINVALLDSVYIPEEFILAAGLLPVHGFAVSEEDRDLISAVISTRFDKSKTKKNKLAAKNSLDLQISHKSSIADYKKALQVLVDFLEQNYKPVKDSDLCKYIRLCNETRYTLSRISEIKRINDDFVDLESWHRLLAYSWTLPREKFNKHAKKILRGFRFIPEKYPGQHQVQQTEIEALNYLRFSRIVMEKRPYVDGIAESYFEKNSYEQDLRILKTKGVVIQPVEFEGLGEQIAPIFKQLRGTT